MRTTSGGVLAATPTKPLPSPRTAELVAAKLRRLVDSPTLDLPMPGHGETLSRWRELAAWGRGDLAWARLAEGHTDALAVLAEAGRTPVPGATYGVWAARSRGTGAHLVERDTGLSSLTGTVRFCSGASGLDRALVAATQGEEALLVEVDLSDPRIRRDPDSWQAIGMDASDSLDVTFDHMPITADARIGDAGWYVTRPGFAWGSGGVAAVWLGGTAGILDAVVELLRESTPDEHQLAHLGALHTALSAADALLARAADQIDAHPDRPCGQLIRTAKSAVERAAWELLDRVPRITGPTPLCRDRRFAQQLADLQVYVRQHHAERDLALVGRQVLDQDGAR